MNMPEKKQEDFKEDILFGHCFLRMFTQQNLLKGTEFMRGFEVKKSRQKQREMVRIGDENIPKTLSLMRCFHGTKSQQVGSKNSESFLMSLKTNLESNLGKVEENGAKILDKCKYIIRTFSKE